MPRLSQPLKKILVINDLSSIGHISLMVNIPILSALGYQVVPLVTTTLSRHTAYKNAIRVDIDASFDAIIDNMIENKDTFDAILIGYLANSTQINKIITLLNQHPKTTVILDPVCADNGKLYTGMNNQYVNSLKKLLPYASVILPNITEALALCDLPLNTFIDSENIDALIRQLRTRCNADIVISGINTSTTIQCAYTTQNGLQYQSNTAINAYVPGTGDIFATLICGYLLKGYPLDYCVNNAATFISNAITDLISTNLDLMNGIPIENYMHLFMKEL